MMHDPFRQLRYLQESLVQDKKPIAFFLGAGCPLSIRVESGGQDGPLIPDIFGMTEQILDRLGVDIDHAENLTILRQHFESAENQPTIEDYLGHIRALRLVAGRDSVRGLRAQGLDALEEAIGSAIFDLANKKLPESLTSYHQLAQWIGSISRQYPVEIFTTNYDLLMEQALEENRVPFFDGFVGSFHPFFDPYAIEEDVLPRRWARVWKLHGSINWCVDSRGRVFRIESSLTAAAGKRRLIHPSHLKYDESRRMPYLAMIDRLKGFLRLPACVLITCGYSFGDQHLNDVIRQGLERNSTAHTFALLYGAIERYGNATAISARRSNLTLLAQDEAVIGARRASYVERARNEIDAGPPEISWKEQARSGEQESPRVSAQLHLGDFSCFCALLSGILGLPSESST